LPGTVGRVQNEHGTTLVEIGGEERIIEQSSKNLFFFSLAFSHSTTAEQQNTQFFQHLAEQMPHILVECCICDTTCNHSLLTH